MFRNRHHGLFVLGVIALWCSGSATLGAAEDRGSTREITPEVLAAEPDSQVPADRDLQWSADGKFLAFIEPAKNAKAPGRSEIWTIDAAGGKRALLVSKMELDAIFSSRLRANDGSDDDDDPLNDNQRVSFAWSPSGHELLLANRTTLAWFDIGVQTGHVLISGADEISNAALSPDGKYVAFVRNHDLWIIDAKGGEARLVSQIGSDDLREGEAEWVYSKEFGQRTAFWWSPDSSAIAYLEFDDKAVARYHLRQANGIDRIMIYPKPGEAIPTVRAFVQNLQSGKQIEIDLGTKEPRYIPRMQWLPDSEHVAIERLSRSQRVLELLIADTARGRSHSVLTEKDDYWINIDDNLHFLSDSRRFLWTSERSGFRHLYMYDIDGQQTTQLTHGNWEVSCLAGVNEVTSTAYFVATAASARERQLYRVNLDGSGLRRITPEQGSHAALLSPDASLFVDTYSSQSTPPNETIRSMGGKIVAALNQDQENSLAPYRLSPVEFFTIKTHMGAELDAFMIKPPSFDASHPYPAIVYIAGGPGEQIVRDKWGGDRALWLQSMAQKGYIVFAIDGRGAAGHGHLFEEPIHLRFSSQEMADERDAVRYLRALPYIDKSRVGIFGWGYGGFLALHGMLDLPIAYKAGIAAAPISDWKYYDAVFSERYLDGPVRNQDGWLASSPLENAKNLKSPLLIVQGTADETVHIENTLTLLDRLTDNGKSADLLLLSDRAHVPQDPQAKLILYRKLTEFFLKNL